MEVCKPSEQKLSILALNIGPSKRSIMLNCTIVYGIAKWSSYNCQEFLILRYIALYCSHVHIQSPVLDTCHVTARETHPVNIEWTLPLQSVIALHWTLSQHYQICVNYQSLSPRLTSMKETEGLIKVTIISLMSWYDNDDTNLNNCHMVDRWQLTQI